MPAAEFWVSFPEVPLFQVCGTKRKHGQESRMQQPSCTDKEDSISKRRCLEGSSLRSNLPYQQHISVNEVNQNHMQDAYLLTSQQNTGEEMQEDGVLPDQPSNIAQTQELNFLTANSQAHPQSQTVNMQQCPLHMLQQEQNIMGLCGETFSSAGPPTSPAQAVDVMAEYMESDFVPDAQQYSSREDGCSSPNRIHCHRPSWDGIMDMKPYVSDIY